MLRVAILGSALLAGGYRESRHGVGRTGRRRGEPGRGIGRRAPRAGADARRRTAPRRRPGKPRRKRERGVASKKHGQVRGASSCPRARCARSRWRKPSGNLEICSMNGLERVASRSTSTTRTARTTSRRSRTLDHVLRCRRTDDEKPIEPRLFTLLSHVYDHFGGKTMRDRLRLPQPAQATSNHYKGRRPTSASRA